MAESKSRCSRRREIVDNIGLRVAGFATMDKLSAMKVFVWVAVAGSFAAVATQLGLACLVVFRQVAALESSLGTKLIARSTRRLALTSAGAHYLEKCRKILTLVEEAEGDLTDARHHIRGHIRLSVPLSLGVRYLTAMICEFTVAHSDVNIELDFSDRRIDLIAECMDHTKQETTEHNNTKNAHRHGTCR